MSDPAGMPPPPAEPPKSRGLGWFFVALGSVVLLLTLGTILSLTEGDFSGESGELALLCGSPTLILGGIFLWLGSRRLKR
jgi:hypothetical protein